MEMTMYATMTGLCLCILVMIWYRLNRSLDQQTNLRLFRKMLTSIILLCALDLIWAMLENGTLRAAREFNYLVNILFFSVSGVCGLLWFHYAQTVLETRYVRNVTLRILAVVPAVLLAGIAACSYFTDGMFYVDALGYHRGAWYFVQPLVVYGYIAVASIQAIRAGLRRENYIRRDQFFSLATFAVFPVLGGVLQVLLPGMPLSCGGICIAALWVYMTELDQRISRDTLTQLNNRREFMRQFSLLLKHADEEEPLYLMLMDIDDFKRINDQFGHPEGDVALKIMAKCLMTLSERYNLITGRYGGDEFIAACHAPDTTAVDAIYHGLERMLEHAAEESGGRYPLRVSLGYAKAQPNENVQDLLRRADAALYQEKRRRKAKRAAA